MALYIYTQLFLSLRDFSVRPLLDGRVGHQFNFRLRLLQPRIYLVSLLVNRL